MILVRATKKISRIKLKCGSRTRKLCYSPPQSSHDLHTLSLKLLTDFLNRGITSHKGAYRHA